MKIKNKWFLALTIATTIPAGFSLIACSTTENNNNLQNNIPKEFDFIPALQSNQEINTNSIINKLINIVFKNNEVKKTQFLETQKQKEQLTNKLKELSIEFNETQNTDKLNDFYTQNWLFIIKNIDKLQWTFTNWWIFPEFENAKYSQQFLEKIADADNPENLKFDNNNWNQLQEGDESRESSDDVFYLRKDNFLIRIYISREGDNKVIFKNIIYFFKSRTKNISIKLISDSVHNALIHKQQIGFDSFENDVVSDYGFGSLGVLLWKENNEQDI
ncbi:aromatic motif membrane protein [Mycoplasma miroungirhinis]|uniref:Lipoprotein n=1 Tax=Mycoplasma miroungirhinis TaxID=754516 RepID=A0A6M4JIA5_9MOLU|nr:aromatic motif membrane protein [Mycoplasma miroungirhinis]QJR44201.1 hypothetical protein HLA92_02015 [Mycoplasma miroungirhinis]